MVVIKGKERVFKEKIDAAKVKLSAKAKKKLKRPQDTQPIATVAV